MLKSIIICASFGVTTFIQLSINKKFKIIFISFIYLYQKINSQYKIAVLLDSLSVDLVVETINKTMTDKQLLNELEQNAMKARKVYNWQNEGKILVDFYRRIFNE